MQGSRILWQVVYLQGAQLRAFMKEQTVGCDFEEYCRPEWDAMQSGRNV
jgi:hypothetical protein